MSGLGAQKLWYFKHGEEVRGPFPGDVVTQYLLLGRITVDDLASLDKLDWRPIRDIGELLPQPSLEMVPGARNWQAERLRAARRWADERSTPDRRGTESAGEGEEQPERRKEDRRRVQESPEILALRERQIHAAARKKERFLGLAAVLAVLVFTVFLSTLLFSPVHPVKVDLGSPLPNCDQAAKPQVNWSGCDKNGAWLRGINLSSANLSGIRFNSAELRAADLSYANLSGADLSYARLGDVDLQGANLSGADLRYADLHNADLKGTDLRGAVLSETNLTGARLGNAIWLDGTVCAAGSVGACLKGKRVP